MPFIPDPECRIAVIAIELSDGVDSTLNIVLSLSHIRRRIRSTMGSDVIETFEWDSWGPESTRVLPSYFGEIGPFSISGGKIVISTIEDGTKHPLEGGGFEEYLGILDFNYCGLVSSSDSRAQEAEGVILRDTEGLRVIEMPYSSTWEDEGATGPVVSKLPYRLLICKRYGDFTGVSFDGYRIVGSRIVSEVRFCSMYKLICD